MVVRRGGVSLQFEYAYRSRHSGRRIRSTKPLFGAHSTAGNDLRTAVVRIPRGSGYNRAFALKALREVQARAAPVPIAEGMPSRDALPRGPVGNWCLDFAKRPGRQRLGMSPSAGGQDLLEKFRSDVLAALPEAAGFAHDGARIAGLPCRGVRLGWVRMAIKKSELYSSIWASCDALRGGMDASQYKDYVLSFLFIKYVSDKYADRHFAPISVPEGRTLCVHWINRGHCCRL